MKFPATRAHGFTLIELIVVILIIATLAAILVPAALRTLDRAKSAQAKNDVTQIVTAVNAFYTEYGKYPLTSAQNTDALATFKTDNSAVINALRAVPSDTLNTRKVVFLSPRQVSDTKPLGGVAPTSGIFYDPWGPKTGIAEAGVYHIAIDGDYDNQITTNPYGDNNGAGPLTLRQGVIAWSLGKDGQLGKVVGGQTVFTGSDDIISWQ